MPVIVSLTGSTSGEFAAAAAGLRRRTVLRGVRGVEVNLGCPDEGNGGIPFSHSEPAATRVVARVREELPRDVPVLAKLSADVTDVVAVARGCVKAGAEALVVTSPLRAVIPGPDGELIPGGLCGPALLPVTLRAVWDLATAIRGGRLPTVAIIAVGGISSAAHVVQALAAGAVGVQLGSALLNDPGVLEHLGRDLTDELAARDLHDVRELIGSAHR